MMDQSIERRFCVYQDRGYHGALLSCPFDQRPPNAVVVFAGSQRQCERYMRDIRRLTARQP